MLPMVSLPTANHPPELLPNFLGEAELLSCTMPRDFVGVRLPRTRWATRAVAQLELSDGTIRSEPVRASAHMAGSRDAVAAFTLLPGEVVAFLRVYTGAGAPLEIPSPPVGSYVQVTQP